jgi:hypothetical protein
MYLGNGPLSWKSTQQKTAPAQSSTEAEYLALVELIKEMLWAHHLLVELGVQHNAPLDVYLDNRAAKSLAEANRNMRAIKHVDTRLLAVRDHVIDGTIKLHHVPTKDNTADLFTKAYSVAVFDRLIYSLMYDV